MADFDLAALDMGSCYCACWLTFTVPWLTRTKPSLIFLVTPVLSLLRVSLLWNRPVCLCDTNYAHCYIWSKCVINSPDQKSSEERWGPFSHVSYCPSLSFIFPLIVVCVSLPFCWANYIGGGGPVGSSVGFCWVSWRLKLKTPETHIT